MRGERIKWNEEREKKIGEKVKREGRAIWRLRERERERERERGERDK